ncbi:MAG: twin-arginine translocation signal domain-containing protein, partial [bacterium]|nr:twin-arginine translocation signal domain-containing protein [bacterium]
MTPELSRRSALTLAAAAACTATLSPKARAINAPTRPPEPEPLFKISLAEWSLHRALFAKELDHLDFP